MGLDHSNFFLKNHKTRRAHIYRKAFWYNVDSSLYKSWLPGFGRGHTTKKHIYICLSGKIFQNLCKKPHTQNSSNLLKRRSNAESIW
jgi:hypothetical protein